MTTYVALLRGINLGNTRKVRMPAIVDAVTDAGGADVRSYIQSGNVVFTHTARSPVRLGDDLERRIEAAAGFPVPVALRTRREWEAVIDGNPFPGVEPTRLHVAFFRDESVPDMLADIDVEAFAPEELVLARRHVYFHLPNGMGRAKLPQAFDRRGPSATTRNWRTVLKLQELAAG